MIPLGRSIATILIPAFPLYWHRGARRGESRARARTGAAGARGAPGAGARGRQPGSGAPGASPKRWSRQRRLVILSWEGDAASACPKNDGAGRGVLSHGAHAGSRGCSRCARLPAGTSGRAHIRALGQGKPGNTRRQNPHISKLGLLRTGSERGVWEVERRGGRWHRASLRKPGHAGGQMALRVAVTGLHRAAALNALASPLLSFQLSCCLLVHHGTINQAISAQDFYSVNCELLSSASSGPTRRKN